MMWVRRHRRTHTQFFAVGMREDIMFRKLIAGSLAALMLLSCSVAAFAATSASDALTTDVSMDDASNDNVSSYRDYQSANSSFPLAKAPVEVKAEGDGAELYLPGDGLTLKFTVDEAGWYEPHITYCALAG